MFKNMLESFKEKIRNTNLKQKLIQLFLKDPFKFLLSLCLLLFFFFTMGILYLYLTLPGIESLADYSPPVQSQILSRDGEVLLEAGNEKREIVELKEIPDVIISAFLAAEDDKFYEHSGVDIGGVIRALLKNIKAGRVVQGGSTITQQVAKSILLNRERSIIRKMRDFLLAIKIEKRFSKEDILKLYLNQVYLGGGYYGVKAAARGYFDKDLSEVTISESAMIAGLLVAPARYSPYNNAQFSKDRQKYVLNRMLDTKKITQQEFSDASTDTLVLRLRKKESFKGGHFTDWVRQRVINLIGEEKFHNDGLKILTTLDWKMQEIGEKEINAGVKEIDRRQGFIGVQVNYPDKTERQNIILQYRESLFKENSHYFKLYSDAKVEFEMDFTQDNFIAIENLDKETKSLEKYTHFENGIHLEDKLIPILNTSTQYKAIVTKVNASQKAIYVSIGGVPGIISLDEYRWAYKRELSEDNSYWSYVTNPNEIVKEGDEVLVSILTNPLKSPLVSQLLAKEFSEREKNNPDSINFFKQRFLKCRLEQNPEIEAALVAMNPTTGEIISMVGGSNFSKSQFNRAIQSLRQPGSAFKPVIYAKALEEGFLPNAILQDTPEALHSVEGGLMWKPRNYDNKFMGPITFRKSLEVSRNVPTIKLVQSMGVSKLVEFIERLEGNADLPKDLSVALGTFGITLLDLTKIYSVLGNGGKKINPYSIVSIVDKFGHEYKIKETVNELISLENQEASEEEVAEKAMEEDESNIQEKVTNDQSVQDSQGNTESNPENSEDEETKKRENPFLASLNKTQVYDTRLSYLMTNLLRGVIKSGTGQSAKGLSNFIGGKTGTTNNYVDAWFLGFSKKITVGVWTGFDNNKTMGWGETGAKAALPIWQEYMRQYLSKHGEVDFIVPDGIVNIYIDKETGEPLDNYDRNAFLESFVIGNEPGNKEGFFPETENSKDQDSNEVIYGDDKFFNN
jgi:penicillin-binding protein 1A